MLYTFLAAVLLLVISLIIKNIELARSRKIFFPSLFAWSDRMIYKILAWVKNFSKHLNFATAWLIFSKIIVSIKKWLAALKARLDHKHSAFFVKREHSNRGAVSFFLKDVSDYKKTLQGDPHRIK